MKFTVSYRGSDGALHDEVFEAANREECFAQCRGQGIVPVRVLEGDTPKRSGKGKSATSPKKKVFLNVAVSVIAGLCLVGAVWWWFGMRAKEVPESTDMVADLKRVHSASKTSIPKPRPSPPHELVPTNMPEMPVVVQPMKTNEIWNGHEIATTRVVTNGTSIITTRVGVDGKQYKQIGKINEQLIFDNPVDQVLALMLTTPKGSMIPPMPPLGAEADDVFIKSLKRPIEIRDDDSPEVKRVKRIVMAAREEMLEELEAGHSVNQVIAGHCTTVNENAKLRMQAIAEYRRILEEDGDEVLAEQYRKKANSVLTNAGATPIDKRGESSRSRKPLDERNQKQ